MKLMNLSRFRRNWQGLLIKVDVTLSATKSSKPMLMESLHVVNAAADGGAVST